MHVTATSTIGPSLPGVFLGLSCEVLGVESATTVRLVAAIEGILAGISLHTSLPTKPVGQDGTAHYILSGDYLFARAFSAALSIRNQECLLILTAMAKSLIEVRMLQLQLVRDSNCDVNPMELLARGAQRTYSFLGCLSAAASSSSKPHRNRMSRIGAELGRARQLDWELARCKSFLEGSGPHDVSDIVATFPYQSAREKNGHCARGERDAETVRRMLADSGSIEATRLMTARNKERFLRLVGLLDDSDYREAIRSLVAIRMMPEGLIAADLEEMPIQAPWQDWLRRSSYTLFCEAAALLNGDGLVKLEPDGRLALTAKKKPAAYAPLAIPLNC